MPNCRLPRREWTRRVQISLSVLLVLEAGIAAGVHAARAADTLTNNPAVPPVGTPVAPVPRSLLFQMQDAFTQLAKNSEPFVVNVKAIRAAAAAPGSSPDAAPRVGEATGSGVIVRPDGYILTNEHVVSGAPYVTITLEDGREFRGKVASDFHSDLAVVKVDPGATPLPTAEFADSDVLPGQWAIAIGSPFDLQNTMTVGIISAVNRHQVIEGEASNTRYYPDLIQTDAAINPGNSGGPLLNIDGKVVGINVAIESPVEASSGVGFAIPSKIAVRIMNDLISKGSVTRGYLGLAPTDLTPAERTEFKVDKGAWVEQVDSDSPAGRAGIHATDVITSFDGSAVTGELSLRDAIASVVPGKSVTIALIRDQKPVTVVAAIAPPPPLAATDTPPAPAPLVAPSPPKKLGLSVRALTASDRTELSLSPGLIGVYVASVTPSSPADLAGVNQDDIVTQVGMQPVATPADFTKAVMGIGPGSVITVVVTRSTHGKLQEIALSLKP